MCLAYISFSHTVATVLPSSIYLAILPSSKNSPEGGLTSCLWPTSDTLKAFCDCHSRALGRTFALLPLFAEYVLYTCHTHFHYTAKIKEHNLLHEGYTKSLLGSVHNVTIPSQTGEISSEPLPNPFVSHSLVMGGGGLVDKAHLSVHVLLWSA